MVKPPCGARVPLGVRHVGSLSLDSSPCGRLKFGHPVFQNPQNLPESRKTESHHPPAAELAEIEANGRNHTGKVCPPPYWEAGPARAPINALAREGRIPRRADGTFDLQTAVRGYIESLRLKSVSSALAANLERTPKDQARASFRKVVEAANARACAIWHPWLRSKGNGPVSARRKCGPRLALPSRAASRII
jgi:hypothetical protein